VTRLYENLCVVAAIGCLIAAAAGGIAFRSGFAHPRAWFGIRVAQLLTVVAAALGTVLLAGAGEKGHGLSYGYSLMAAGVSFGAEQLRLASAASVLGGLGMSSAAEVAQLEPAEQERIARRIALRELGVEVVALVICAALLLRGATLY
jgi:hypothetical protein